MSGFDLTEALDRHAADRGAHLAAVDGPRTLDWAGLRAAVDARAGELRAAGISAGDVIALRADDGIPALVHAFAALRCGAVHAPIDTRLGGPALQDALARLRPHLLVEVDRAGGHRQLRGDDGRRHPIDGAAFLRLSSGTTGDSKGVLLCHRAIAERADLAAAGLGLRPGDRMLWLLPMAYHFAVSIGAYLRHGVAVVFGQALRASRTAAIARAREITHAYASPYHVARLAVPDRSCDLPPSLRAVVVTTAPIEAGVRAAFVDRHGVPVRQALGIIEVGLPFVSPGDRDEDAGFLGIPLPGYEARADDGGALLLRGPGMFAAYVDPWRRCEAVCEGGWFRSGDLVERHGAAFRLLGRCRELINVGGVKVFPLEVETVLDAHPDVAASMAVAVPDPRSGEAVGALVEWRGGGEAEAAQARLRDWCTARLPALSRPHRYRFVQLPRTPSGKVARSRVAWEEVPRPEAEG